MARHLDIAAATGAAVYFCASTFRKELICRGTAAPIWHEQNTNSTTDPERYSTIASLPQS
jgi:hypothetical protein